MFTLSDIGMGDDIHDDVSSIGHNEMTFFKNIHQDSRRTIDSGEVPIEEIKDRQSSRRGHQKNASSMDISDAPAEIDKIVTAYNQHMTNSNANPLARSMGTKDLKKEGLFRFGQNKQNNSRAGSYVETPPESDDMSMIESSSHYSKNNLEFNLGKVQEQEQDLRIFEESDEEKEADEKIEDDTKTIKSNKSRK